MERAGGLSVRKKKEKNIREKKKVQDWQPEALEQDDGAVGEGEGGSIERSFVWMSPGGFFVKQLCADKKFFIDCKYKKVHNMLLKSCATSDRYIHRSRKEGRHKIQICIDVCT